MAFRTGLFIVLGLGLLASGCTIVNDNAPIDTTDSWDMGGEDNRNNSNNNNNPWSWDSGYYDTGSF